MHGRKFTEIRRNWAPGVERRIIWDGMDRRISAQMKPHGCNLRVGAEGHTYTNDAPSKISEVYALSRVPMVELGPILPLLRCPAVEQILRPQAFVGTLEVHIWHS